MSEKWEEPTDKFAAELWQESENELLIRVKDVQKCESIWVRVPKETILQERIGSEDHCTYGLNLVTKGHYE